jgi:hypothetical protein
MNTKYLIAISAAAGCLLVNTTASAQAAAPVFNDDFESRAPGSRLTAPWGSVTAGTDCVLEVLRDDANRFGRGTDNRILHLKDAGAGLTRADCRFGGATNGGLAVAMLAFDIYEVEGVDGTPLRVSIGLDSSKDIAHQVTFHKGYATGIARYTQNAAHAIAIIINTSKDSVSYNDGTDSVAPLQYALWIDGRRAAGGKLSGSSWEAGTPVTAFRFTTDAGGASQEVYIDNIRLFSGANAGAVSPAK